MVNVGNPAPNFKLLNNKKEEISLESLRGKKVVLAFFPGAFTGVCTTEMCTFRDQLAAFNSVGGTVLGISVDSPLANNAFIEKNNLSFPILSDFTRATIKSYDIVLENFSGMAGYTAAKRAVFVVDSKGNVAWQWISNTPKDEPDYAAVKAAVEKAG